MILSQCSGERWGCTQALGLVAGVSTSMMCSESMGAQKLGHPVPDSNLVSEEKRGRPPTADTYKPAFLLSWLYPLTVCPVNAGSVPLLRAMLLHLPCCRFFPCLIWPRGELEMSAARFAVGSSLWCCFTSYLSPEVQYFKLYFGCSPPHTIFPWPIT